MYFGAGRPFYSSRSGCRLVDVMDGWDGSAGWLDGSDGMGWDGICFMVRKLKSHMMQREVMPKGVIERREVSGFDQEPRRRQSIEVFEVSWENRSMGFIWVQGVVVKVKSSVCFLQRSSVTSNIWMGSSQAENG